MTFVTPAPWGANLQHPLYATVDTYRLAAEWLKDCPTVADWGGGSGFLGTVLPAGVAYRVVDGTVQSTEQTLADLRDFCHPSDGILIRHVLELNVDWSRILRNALTSFGRRMVVITFTPPVAETGLVKMKSGWPVMHFNPADLRREMGPLLVRDEIVATTHPEHLYYLERAA